MKRSARGALLALTAVIAACGTGAPGETATTPSPVGFEESQAAFCSSFGAMLRAVGNPDTAAPSVLSKSLDDAVEVRDVASAERAATAILTELQFGRQEAARAGQWAPAQPGAVAMDALLAAFEAMVAAKVAKAAGTPGSIEPQAAFEQARGIEAWTAMLTELQTVPLPAGATPMPCKAFSGTP